MAITAEIMQYARSVWNNALTSKQRVGQYLYNHLPMEAALAVTGRTFDPFFKDMALPELAVWISDHLILDQNQIVAVFDQEEILWRDDSKTPPHHKDTNA